MTVVHGVVQYREREDVMFEGRVIMGPHSVIMSLSDSAWSSPPFRSSPTNAAQLTHPSPSACSS